MTDELLAAEPRLGSVLIIEDEGLLAILMEDIVREMGAEGVHVFSDVASARQAAASTELDCAILDLVLRDGSSQEIADILGARGIPFVFSTGSGGEGIPPHHRHRPIISKPFADADLKAGLRAAMAAADKGRRQD